MNQAQKEAILNSWKLVVPIAETAADLFYKRLFELRPDYRRLFPEDLAAQKRKLMRMLAFVVRSIDFADSEWRESIPADEDLMLVILALGRRHTEIYKIPDESYAAVGEALLWTFDYALGKAFTPEVKDAWTHIYGVLATAMRMGSRTIDRDAGVNSSDIAFQKGEEALLVAMNEAGIDEAKMGFREESP